MSSNPQQKRDEDMVRLLRHLFHSRFCPENSVDGLRKGSVLPVWFLGWLDSRMPDMDMSEECQIAKVDIPIWEGVREILASGAAVERFNPVWYAIVLSDRPEPQHRLTQMNLVMLLTYDDGTIVPTQIFVTEEMLSGPKFNDAVIASICAKNVNAFVKEIVEKGLDGLHDSPGAKNYRGSYHEDPYAVLRTYVIGHLLPQLPEQVRGEVELYQRLLQAIVRPVIPPDIKAKIAAARAEWERQHQEMAQSQKRTQEGGARGGWDA